MTAAAIRRAGAPARRGGSRRLRCNRSRSAATGRLDRGARIGWAKQDDAPGWTTPRAASPRSPVPDRGAERPRGRVGSPTCAPSRGTPSAGRAWWRQARGRANRRTPSWRRPRGTIASDRPPAAPTRRDRERTPRPQNSSREEGVAACHLSMARTNGCGLLEQRALTVMTAASSAAPVVKTFGWIGDERRRLRGRNGSSGGRGWRAWRASACPYTSPQPARDERGRRAPDGGSHHGGRRPSRNSGGSAAMFDASSRDRLTRIAGIAAEGRRPTPWRCGKAGQNLRPPQRAALRSSARALAELRFN